MVNNRKDNDFKKPIVEKLGKRASFVCSNPDCRCLTLCPSDNNSEDFTYIGKAAHITAAAKGGPRYDESLSTEQRSSIENGIFLCSNCADMIDKNDGQDFTVVALKKWKSDHETWVSSNLNKSLNSSITIIDGEHIARGKGNVTAIKTSKPTFFKPGTRSVAEGEGNIIATLIG